MKEHISGIRWIVGFTMVDAVALNIARILAQGMHIYQMISICNAIAATILFVMLYRSGDLGVSKNIKFHVARVSAELVGAGLMFYSLLFIPISEVKAILFLIPILATIAAIVFLGEHSSPAKWGALILGFIGMLVILQPGKEVIHFASFMSLGAAVFLSIGLTIIKKVSFSEPPLMIAFYFTSLTSIGALPLALYFWQPIAQELYIWILIFGIIIALAHITITNAVAHAPLVVVTPFFFLGLIFVSIIAYFVYDEVPGAATFIGGAIILGAATYVTYRECKNGT